MNNKTRMLIWGRDGGVCQKCKINLINKIDYYEEALEKLDIIEEIPIYKWKKECWYCKKETDIVSYDFNFLFDFHIGDIEVIDNLLIEKYPFVKRGYSKTQEKECVANWCIHCGKLQGNFFIATDLLMQFNEHDQEDLIDTTIPNILKIGNIPVERDDEYIFEEKNTKYGHIHHINLNRKNNNLRNLILLCRKCHVETHVDIRRKRK